MPDIQCGIYCRMSVAADDDTTKVDSQEKLCREAAARLGWNVTEVYQDNNRSAWKKNRKRPGWDRMLADVESGKITAIMVYHGDRLIRQPDDLGVLLKLADGKGIRLASPTGERDLGSGDDRFVLYIEAAMAMRESDNTSRRRKAQYERWRREGKVRPGGHGGRAFGYTTKGEVVPEEAEIIREAAARILAGEFLGSVTRDLAARGITGTAGATMEDTTLRKMLLRPRFAAVMPDGISPGSWEPILDRGEWEALCATIRTTGKLWTPNGTTTRRYLLTGIAECGPCGKPLQTRQSSGRSGRPAQKGYACVQPGCRKVYRSITLLDAYVTGRVIRRLNDPANEPAEIDVTEGVAAEIQAITERRAEAVAIIENLADHPGQRLDVLARALDSFDRRLAQLRETAGDGARSRVLDAHRGMTREDFDAADLSVRRSIVAACFRITVLPTSRGRGFRPEDVSVTPR